MNPFTIFLSSALMPKQLGMPLPGKKVLDCVLAAIYHLIDSTLYKNVYCHILPIMASTSWLCPISQEIKAN